MHNTFEVKFEEIEALFEKMTNYQKKEGSVERIKEGFWLFGPFLTRMELEKKDVLLENP